jgi:hypothetical protein
MIKKMFLFVVLLVGIICILISCGTQTTLVERIDAYQQPNLAIKDYMVIGIITIRPLPEKTKAGRLVADPVNLRLMEEAKKLGADDLINVRIDWVPRYYGFKWIAATAVAIKYVENNNQ